MSEPTIYKPSIYNGNGVYKNGADGGKDIKSVEICGVTYPVKKIGNLFWTTENIRIHTSEYRYPNNNPDNENTLGLLYKYKIAQNEILINLPGLWRLPDKKDINDLFSVSSNPLDYVSEDFGGTNKTGFNATFPGAIDFTNNVVKYNEKIEFWSSQYSFNSDLDSNPPYVRMSIAIITLLNKSISYSAADSKSNNTFYTSVSVRLCCDS